METVSIINSRFGPTDKQIEGFRKLIGREFNPNNHLFQHGGDRADISINSILSAIGYKVKVHPHSGEKNPLNWHNVIIELAEPLNQRNSKLVETSETVIGLPQSMNEWEDSPCWKTLRAAIAAEKRVIIITPRAGYSMQFMR